MARQAALGMNADDKVLDYLLGLVRQTHQHPDLALGASGRSAVARSHGE